jgi:hypothetical protein
VTQFDPNTDPTRVPPPPHARSVETVVVRDSGTGWWIAGILGGGVLIALLWILFAGGPDPQSDQALLEAQLDTAAARAQADSALINGQVAGAQASVDIVRAACEARAAEARAATPVVIEREVQVPVPAIVTPTAPQN